MNYFLANVTSLLASFIFFYNYALVLELSNFFDILFLRQFTLSSSL